jgi:type IV pilus assembly protein PilB
VKTAPRSRTDSPVDPADVPTPRTRRRAAGESRLLGALLLRAGALTSGQLESALSAQQRSGERLGDVVVRLGFTGEEMAEALAAQLGLPYQPPPLVPDPASLALVPEALARRRLVLPLGLGTGRDIRVAMADPLDLGALDDVQFRTGRRVDAVVASPGAVVEALHLSYGDPARDPEPPADADPAAAGLANPRRVGPATEAEPAPAVIPLVDRLLREAIRTGASDLHVEQAEGEVRIRARVDGILRRVAGVPPELRLLLLSRIKVMAGMDISVRRRPQDGGFRVEDGGRRLSVRASTLPVEGGEKAVLRILDPSRVPAGLDELGVAPADLARLRELIRAGRGVVLAAGPTGSGKSSTLFGALAEVDRERLNVVTLEDPIEYRVPGVNQVQVSPRAGLTFPAALRSVLRQDPDVIMVGEIRDRETAEIAMAAAVTGHLVLSTIHTTDAPGGITRLLQMGVPSHLVAGGLAGIVSQRLVRVRCADCGGRQEGCGSCHEGYRGRTGVFELLTVTDGLREEVMRGAGTEVLRRRAREGGMGSMASDARRKVAEGVTTPHEVARVLHRSPGSRPPCERCQAELPEWARGCHACGHPAEPECMCGTRLQPDWRYCPACLRKAPPRP